MAERVQVAANTSKAKENSASTTRKIESSQTMSSPADQVLYLQRTIGNQAVQRLIKSGALQAKLKIGQPGDRYEQEADKVAEQVSRAPEPQLQRQPVEEEEKEEEEELVQTKPISDEITPKIQRQEAAEEEEGEEELVQAKPITEQTTPLIQRQAEGAGEEEKEEVVQLRSEKSVTSSDPVRYVQRAVAWIQAKLTIGQPNDRYEQEADRMADAVMRMPDPQVQRKVEGGEEKEEEEVVQTKSIAEQITPLIQRQVEVGKGEEEKEEENPVQAKLSIQRQADNEEEEGPVQAKPDINPARNVSASMENAIQTNDASGVPLSEQTQAKMVGRFGADFSAVRVHTDANAAQMNRAIRAQAFTHGSHIYFGAGKYNPHSNSGEHLLAHELTHVVQQGSAVSRKPASISKSPRSIQRWEEWIPGYSTGKRVLKGVYKGGKRLVKGVYKIGKGFVKGTWKLIKGYVQYIPGYKLFTVIIGYDPLTDRKVTETPKNLLSKLMKLHKLTALLYEKIIELRIVNRAFTFVRKALKKSNLSLERLKQTFKNAWKEMDLIRLDTLSHNKDVLRRHFGKLLKDVKKFALSIANRILVMIRDALLSTLRWVAEKIPGYPLLTKILRYDPVTKENIKSNTVQIIEEFLKLIGKHEHLKKMRKTGTIKRVGDWIDTQLAHLKSSFKKIPDLFSKAWNEFSFSDVKNPTGAFKRTVNIFRPFASRIWKFAKTVAITVLKFIKDALLGALSRFARNKVPGFTLLTVILERNPFSGIRVARNATNLIGGFMEFVPGGREKFKNLQKSGTIDRAFEWLGNEVMKLKLSWKSIKKRFRTAWKKLSIHDLIDPTRAFWRMVKLFSSLIGSIIRFAAAVGMKILEFIFEGVMGAGGAKVLNILKRVGNTFLMIVKDPIAFVGNLIKAVVQGFKQFVSKILKHLRKGLVDWLFGALEGTELKLPEKFDSRGIISLGLQILGLTYQRIRPKLVRLLGERTVSILERTFEFLRLLVTKGPVAAWKKIVEYAGNLRDKVMEGIRNFVITKVVTTAVKQLAIKLATMWNPGGMIVQAIIGIYNTIMFFIERRKQIMRLVESITNSISSIAAGNIKEASNYVEKTMGRFLPVIISFFARLLGLGNISSDIKNIISKIRRPIDRATDRMVGWIAKQAKRLAKRGRAGIVQWWRSRKQFKTKSGKKHTLFFKGKERNARLMIASNDIYYDRFIADAERAVKENKIDKELVKRARKYNLLILSHIKSGRNLPQETFNRIINRIEQISRTIFEQMDQDKPDGTKEKPYWIMWHKDLANQWREIEIMTRPDSPKQKIHPLKRTTVIVGKDADLPIRIKRLEDSIKEQRTRFSPDIIKEHAQKLKDFQAAEKRKVDAYHEYQKLKGKGNAEAVEAAKKNREETLASMKIAVGAKKKVEDEASRQRELRGSIKNDEAKLGRLRDTAQTPGENELRKIGISGDNQVSVDKVVGPSRKRPPNPNRKLWKKFLEKAGFNWKGYSADHVVDLSFGGPDDDCNLWPVKINPVPNQRIDSDSGKQVGISKWNNKKSGGKLPWQDLGKFYKIFGVKKP